MHQSVFMLQEVLDLKADSISEIFSFSLETMDWLWKWMTVTMLSLKSSTFLIENWSYWPLVGICMDLWCRWKQVLARCWIWLSSPVLRWETQAVAFQLRACLRLGFSAVSQVGCVAYQDFSLLTATTWENTRKSLPPNWFCCRCVW